MNRRLISIIIVAVGMIAGAVLVSNQQNINEEASEISEAGKITIQPVLNEDSTAVEQIQVKLSTGTADQNPIKISSFSVRLQYPGDITSEVASVDSKPFKISEDLSDDWKLTVNEITFENGVTRIDLAGIYSGVEGYSTQTLVDIAHIDFVNDEFTVDDYAVLGWNEDYVKMMTKEMPVQDIVKTINKK